MKIRKMQTAAGGPLFPWLKQDTEWADNWKFRTTPASRSRVLSGKGVETPEQYTTRRKQEETKRTWRSDAADIAHGIGEGVLALHPYTAIPYFGAKVGLDFLNGTYGWHTALNASVPLFHLAPQAVGLKEATNVALEDAASAGSKTARNWRVAREINLTTRNKPNIEVPKPIIRTRVGDVEVNNPQLAYRLIGEGGGKNFLETGYAYTPLETLNMLAYKNGTFKPTILLKIGYEPGWTTMRPMYSQGKLWFGEGKGDLITTAQPLRYGNSKGGITKSTAKAGTRRVSDYHGEVTPENATVYTWVPGYGYKKVIQEPSTSLKFFERKPLIKNEKKIGTREPEMRFNEKTGEFEIIPISKLFEEKFRERVPPKYIRDSNLTYGEFSDLANIANSGFIPKASVDVGKFNRMYSEETINRLKDLGYDIRTPVPLLLKGFTTLKIPENYIRENVESPVYLGYYLDGDKTMGTYYHAYDKAVADPTLANNLPSVMFHERNMHGTDALILAYEDVGQPLAKNMYLNFLDKLFYIKKGSGDVQIINPANKVSFTEDGKVMIDFNGTKRPMLEGTDLWYEGRSTINELKRKYLLNTWRQYNKPKLLEDIRSKYIKDIDNMSENILLNDLETTNGYGSTYVNLKDNNPNFIKDLKELLKSGAGYVTPVVGGYTLYNLLNNLNNLKLEYRKQGGILKALLGNIVPLLPYLDTIINDSSITNSHLNWSERYKNWIFELNKLKAQLEAEEAKLRALKADLLGEHISLISNLLINKFANKALNKNGTPVSTNQNLIQTLVNPTVVNTNWNDFSTNPSLQYDYNLFKTNSWLNGDTKNYFA